MQTAPHLSQPSEVAPEAAVSSELEAALLKSRHIYSEMFFPPNLTGQWWHHETLYQTDRTDCHGICSDISHAGRFQIPSICVPATLAGEPDYADKVCAKARQIGVSIVVRLSTPEEISDGALAQRWLDAGAKGVFISSHFDRDSDLAQATRPLLAQTARYSEGVALLLSHRMPNTKALARVLAENWVHVFFHGLIDFSPWSAPHLTKILPEIYGAYQRFGTTPGWYVGQSTVERTHGPLTPEGAVLFRLALPGMLSVGSTLEVTATIRAALRLRTEYHLASAPITMIDVDPRHEAICLNVGRLLLVANFSAQAQVIPGGDSTLLVSDNGIKETKDGLELGAGCVAWVAVSQP